MYISISSYTYTYRYIHIHINIYIHTSSTATTTMTHPHIHRGGGGTRNQRKSAASETSRAPPQPHNHRGGGDHDPSTGGGGGGVGDAAPYIHMYAQVVKFSPTGQTIQNVHPKLLDHNLFVWSPGVSTCKTNLIELFHINWSINLASPSRQGNEKWGEVMMTNTSQVKSSISLQSFAVWLAMMEL